MNSIWERYNIDQELIDAFMDRVFRRCGNSFFEFDRVLRDYAYSGVDDFFSGKYCDECQDLMESELEVEELKGDLKAKRKRINELIDDVGDLKYEKKELMRTLDNLSNELHSLRKKLSNSVIFSMDEGD